MNDLYLIRSTITDHTTGDTDVMHTTAESTEIVNGLVKMFNNQIRSYNLNGWDLTIHHELYKLMKGAILNVD